MTRILLICAALVAALSFLSPAPGFAGEQDKSIYGNWPADMHRENPFADDLAAVRERLDKAIARFWDVYARDPWNYWVVVDAYYAYADAYHRYVWTLWRYWQWENTHYRFSGRVLTRDLELFRPFEVNAKDTQAIKDEALRMPRPEQPVPGATITLERNVMFLAGQPLAQKEEAKQVAAVGMSIVAPGPNQGYTARADDRGRFDFRGIPRGSYRYTVSAEGFFPQSGLVEIAATRQERDIHLTRHRRFEGVVFTVTRDCIPILRPLLAKAGSSVVDVASADEVEKILGSDQRILPQFRRLIPVEGARVTLHSNAAVLFPGAPGAPGAPAAPGAPGQLLPIPGQVPGQLPVPGQVPGQLPPVPGQVPGQLPPVPGQVPGQLPPVPGQVPGQLPPLPGQDGTDKSRPIFQLPEPTATTGNDGRFLFQDLGQTSYRVSVEKNGFLPFNALINLERAQTWRRIVIFPFVPFEPLKGEPVKTEQTDADGKSLNDPFTK